MTTIGTDSKTWPKDKYRQREEAFEQVRVEYQRETAEIRTGGVAKAIERQNGKRRLTTLADIQLARMKDATEETRDELIRCLELCDHPTEIPAPKFGVLQVWGIGIR